MLTKRILLAMSVALLIPGTGHADTIKDMIDALNGQGVAVAYQAFWDQWTLTARNEGLGLKTSASISPLDKAATGLDLCQVDIWVDTHVYNGAGQRTKSNIALYRVDFAVAVKDALEHGYAPVASGEVDGDRFASLMFQKGVTVTSCETVWQTGYSGTDMPCTPDRIFPLAKDLSHARAMEETARGVLQACRLAAALDR